MKDTPINFFLKDISEGDKERSVKKLIESSTPDNNFFLFVVLSILMATSGLLADNSAVIIGSMLITPILYPVLSLSMGLVMSDPRLVNRSLLTILKSMVVAVIASTLLALFLGGEGIITSEVLVRTHPSLLYFVIAVVAGFAGSLALIDPKFNETLPGVAISVALIPPLAVMGIGVATWSWDIFSSSLLLFVINITGIVFISMVNFSLMNLYIKRRIAETAIDKEEVKLEKEADKK